MSKQIEALKLALEALEHEAETGNDDAYRRERDAIREVLADSALAHKVKMYEDALGEIAWSNNSEWQQDRAKQVLAQMRGVEL